MSNFIFGTLNGIKMMAKNTLRHNIASIFKLSKTKTAALTVSSVILLTWASPVSAGFEWKAPVPAAPPVVVEKQSIAPTPQNNILWKENISKMPIQKIQGVESVPIIITDRIMPERIVPERIVSDRIVPYSTTSTIPEGIVSGFGTELPLEIALQQIIPPTYKFSFAPGVNPATIVSWRGEKSWKEVLTDMLSTRNLGFSHQNNIVTISKLPTLYPPVSTSSSFGMIKSTTVNKADMIPTDMIFNDKMKRTTLPASAVSPLSVPPPSTVVVAPLDAPAPLTSVPRIIFPEETKKNKAVETKKLETVTIRREKPKTPLISRLLGLNNDKNKVQHRVAPPQEKIVKTAPPVKETIKNIPDISISQKMNNISPANAAPDSEKVDLAAYYRTEQVLKNKKADMIPTDMISNTVVKTSAPTMIHAEKPAPLTAKIPSQDMSTYQKTSLISKPEIKIAKAKVTNAAPNIDNTSWQASGGQTLRTILSNWSRTAKVELHWDIDYDYRLNEDVIYKGNFNSAVEKLLDRYTKVRPQPYGRLIQKNSGDNILIVNSYDFSY